MMGMPKGYYPVIQKLLDDNTFMGESILPMGQSLPSVRRRGTIDVTPSVRTINEAISTIVNGASERSIGQLHKLQRLSLIHISQFRPKPLQLKAVYQDFLFPSMSLLFSTIRSLVGDVYKRQDSVVRRTKRKGEER